MSGCVVTESADNLSKGTPIIDVVGPLQKNYNNHVLNYTFVTDDSVKGYCISFTCV